ncbi:FtsH-interacting integral membrane protein [Pseudomonas phage vB_PaeM_PA5oct]|uniref:FtsH-interacting integral membrane protein n=1 Tax=Pseudomonas phage vB_PaeM_PA5oct TaxID=2163605 RepID=A0A4Y5JTX6_9CAUD|nr:FtsH-interacting integral membrane protein [Pseudomonas phage vB_PaeM_PA5oct]QCG76146.1 FtsH-interacting integral membrane protein [Pseudomonas phage vB_PaeM_PA5oct]
MELKTDEQKSIIGTFATLMLTRIFAAAGAYLALTMPILNMNLLVCIFSYFAIMFIIDCIRTNVYVSIVGSVFLLFWQGITLGNGLTALLGEVAPLLVLVMFTISSFLYMFLCANAIMSKNIFSFASSFNVSIAMTLLVTIVMSILLDLSVSYCIGSMIINVINCVVILKTLEDCINEKCENISMQKLSTTVVLFWYDTIMESIEKLLKLFTYKR